MYRAIGAEPIAMTITKNRDRHAIIYGVLKSLADSKWPLTRTMIYYKVMMSNDQTRHYIGNLIEKGLIKEERGGYAITLKGRKSLDLLDELFNLLPDSCRTGQRIQEFSYLAE